MDVLEHEPRQAPSPHSLLAAGCALTLVAGFVAVARHDPPVRPAVATSDAAAPGVVEEAWSGPRRIPAALLPPDRPRRSSRTQIGEQRPEVPRLGTVGAGRAPGRVAAQQAAYAMAARLCRDPSLLRLRTLRQEPDWSAVTYYARVHENPPTYGGFVVALTWTGAEYAYTVTGKAGDCRDLGTG